LYERRLGYSSTRLAPVEYVPRLAVEYDLPLFERRAGEMRRRKRRTESVPPPQEGGAKGASTSTSTSSTSAPISPEELMYSIPASQCPPLLILLIDGTSTDANYYVELSRSIHTALFGTAVVKGDDDDTDDTKGDGGSQSASAPPSPPSWKGTKVGIFIMTSGGGLSILHLNSRVGHVKHTWVDPPPLIISSGADNRKSPSQQQNGGGKVIVPLAKLIELEDVFVSLGSEGKRSCVETALRDLENSTVLIQKACHRRCYDDSNSNSNSSDQIDGGDGVYLGSTIQSILEFMEDVGCHHPGEDFMGDGGNNKMEEEDGSQRDFVPYAGGKIMCFLAGPPAEIGGGSPPPSSTRIMMGENTNGRMGTGGFGGTCAEMGRRFGGGGDRRSMPRREDIVDDPEDPESRNRAVNSTLPIKDYTLPDTAYEKVDDYFQELGIECAHAALGVEIFALLQEEGDDESVQEEVYFGFPLLRLLSDRSGGCGPLLVPIMLEKGVWNRDNSQDIFVKELVARSPWHRPTAFGALLRIRLSDDLEIEKSHDELGRAPATRSNGSKYYKSGSLYGSVSCTEYDEDLYCMGSCDSLSTLSFNARKVQLSSLFEENDYRNEDVGKDKWPCVQTCFAYTAVIEQNGEWITVRRLRVLNYVFTIAKDTESFLASVDIEAMSVNLFHRFYHVSLQNGSEEAQSVARRWLISTLLSLYRSAEKYKEDADRYNFSPSDRLLGAGNDLSRLDILLGQGHKSLRDLPLLIFSLLQSDAIRPNKDSYNPSIDARYAAAANMCTMVPKQLHRCIAPRLQLWLNDGTNQPCLDDVKRSWNGIDVAVVDQVGEFQDDTVDRGPAPLLLLDSPRNILIYDYHRSTQVVSVGVEEHSKRLSLGYRVAPVVPIAITGDMAIARSYLMDALIEDAAQSGSFDSWCEEEIAECLYAEITDGEE